MDDLRFDRVTRAFAAAPSRRLFLKGLFAGTLGVAVARTAALPGPVSAEGTGCIWDMDCAENEGCVDADGYACGLDIAICEGLLESDPCGLNGTCELVDGELACVEYGGESCDVPSDCYDIYGPYAVCLGGQCHYPTTKACHCEPYDNPSTAIVVVHKLECPRELAEDPHGNCHGNSLDGVEFAIGNVGDADFPVGATADGGLLEREVLAGEVYIEELPEYVGYGVYVYCSDFSDKTQVFNKRVDDGVVSFSVLAGTTVVCDWYNITDDGKKDDDEPSDDGNSDGGVKLPETGAGAVAGGAGQIVGLAAAAGLLSFVSGWRKSARER